MDEGTAVSQPMTSRPARRAATQARILDAARQEFGDRGFEATTVRGVARRAGVDPSLVLQHYGSKSALFTAAIQLPPGEPEEAADHVADVLKVRRRIAPRDAGPGPVHVDRARGFRSRPAPPRRANRQSGCRHRRPG